MVREYHKWFSSNLNREMELLVFGHAGRRVIVFPTRMGRFYDYENFGMAGSLQDQVDAGALQLFCVDSEDHQTFYSKHHAPHQRIAGHSLYESYILEEVIPFTAKNNPSDCLVAHGCSFGAYHAVNIALRHPTLFQEVVAFSGRYDLTKQMGDFGDLFDGYYSEDIYFHMPNHFVPNLWDEAILQHLRNMRIVLAVGAEDAFYDSNVALSNALNEKDIPNQLYVWEGEAHRSRHWRRMTRLYLAPECNES
jgi:esterase/lipase superfamily enzyme